jgi:tetratricopeptide (TPR) repeat protein
VNRETFIHLIHHTDQVSPADKETLEEVIRQYPYFQLAHFLLAKAHNQEQTVLTTDKVKKAAVYAPDRGMLKKFLSIKKFAQEYISPVISTAEKNVEADSPAASTTSGTEPVIEHPALPMSDYQLAGTEKEEEIQLQTLSAVSPHMQEEKPEIDKREIRKIKQNEIIENFIKAEPRISAAQAKDKGVEMSAEDLSEKTVDTATGFVSENLANIMVKQGKIDKAIDIYEKLILKYPQKNAYFAAKIEGLKNL